MSGLETAVSKVSSEFALTNRICISALEFHLHGGDVVATDADQVLHFDLLLTRGDGDDDDRVEDLDKLFESLRKLSLRDGLVVELELLDERRKGKGVDGKT